MTGPLSAAEAGPLWRSASTQEERDAIDLRWRAYVNETYGEGLSPAQLAVVHGLAYQEGHAYGLSEIEGYFGTFADFARNLLAA